MHQICSLPNQSYIWDMENLISSQLNINVADFYIRFGRIFPQPVWSPCSVSLTFSVLHVSFKSRCLLPCLTFINLSKTKICNHSLKRCKHTILSFWFWWTSVNYVRLFVCLDGRGWCWWLGGHPDKALRLNIRSGRVALAAPHPPTPHLTGARGWYLSSHQRAAGPRQR